MMSNFTQLDSSSINLAVFPARIWQPKQYPLPIRKPKNRGRNQTMYGALDTHDQTVYWMVCDTTNRRNCMEFLRRIVSE